MLKSLIFLLALLPLGLAGQQLHVVTGAAQQMSGGHYQITATLGEPAIQLVYGSGQLVTAGFEQGSLPEKPALLPATDVRSATPPLAPGASVFPNPAVDNLFVSIPGNTQTATMVLYNSQGNAISTTTTTADLTELQIGQLPAGLYRIILYTSQAATGAILSFEKIKQ